MDDDLVFKALADPTRRGLLDRLRQRNGQTLGELCDGQNMARQSLTQHIGILEGANLVAARKQGREKLHFINPVPIHDVYERWVRGFEHQRLALLHNLKNDLERRNIMTTNNTSLVYVSYIKSTPEQVFAAITRPELAKQYWGHENVSDWQPGAEWQHVRDDPAQTVDVVGKVVEISPPTRLVLSWANPSRADDPASYSRVTFEVEEYDRMVKLTVIHDELEEVSSMAVAVGRGWPVVLSSLKSFLETGEGIELSAKPKAA